MAASASDLGYPGEVKPRGGAFGFGGPPAFNTAIIRLLFLSQVLRLFLGSTIGGAEVLDARYSRRNSDMPVTSEDAGGGGGTETAIVFTTRMPIKPLLLERVFGFSREIASIPKGPASSTRYRLAVIVDVTKALERGLRATPAGRGHWMQGAAGEAFRDYYIRQQGNETWPSEQLVPMPLIFEVTEELIFQEYPKLINYFNNGPDEKNANDEPGQCCGQSFVWQGFVPVFTMFLHHHPHFDFAWRFEDDLGVVGRDSLITLVRDWDGYLNLSGTFVDLAGETTHINGIPSRNRFLKLRHSMSFHEIILRMGVNYTIQKHHDAYGWERRHGEWECYTDAIQRHSRRFSNELYRKISDNVYQFGECFVQPIAWDANLTTMELTQINRGVGNRVGNLPLTGPRAKRTRKEALNTFITSKSYSTLLFHEKPMNVRRQRMT